MAHGRLRAIGSPAELKFAYGGDYNVSILTEPSCVHQVKENVESRVPGAVLEDDGAGALVYRIPTQSTTYIPALAKFLGRSKGDYFIKAWGISQISLEQIFLRIVRYYQKDVHINGDG
jgi:hypothetical protein